jgi:hypothetical protein
MSTADVRQLADQATRAASLILNPDDQEVRGLTEKAIRIRPELAGLSAQARSLNAQADAKRAAIRPQVGFAMAFI